VVSPTPRPHFTPGKDPVPIVQEAGWAPGPVWKGGKSRPHRNSIPDRPGRSSVTIPTELTGPHNIYIYIYIYIYYIHIHTHTHTYIYIYIYAIPAGVKFTMCIDISNHTQHIPHDRFIVWQLLSISSVGHHQATVHEQQFEQKLPPLFTVPTHSYY